MYIFQYDHWFMASLGTFHACHLVLHIYGIYCYRGDASKLLDQDR